ncbi:MAG: AAA family ATPase [Polyangiales bacterium]
MAQKKSFRVYLVAHGPGLISGTLIRTWDGLFDRPPPAALGATEDEVLAQLEAILQAMTARGDDGPERYLWAEDFATREVTVTARPQTVSDKRAVIGAREIPLRLTYCWCKLPQGGYRVMLPRYGWWMVIEDLAIAGEVLRSAVSAALLGESPRSIYDFRREGEEWVRPWAPRSLAALEDAERDSPARRWPVAAAVAEDLVERAARQRLPAPLGESDDFRQALALFEADPRPSVLLVGPSGVGKTTLVRRLARHLLARHRERADRDDEAPHLWATSAARLIAGMVYVGMWQERCLKLVDELSWEGHWLFLDRLVPLLQPQADGASIGEILLPAAAEGALSLIAECTPEEYERCQRRFPTLLEAMRVVRVSEPAPHQIPALITAWQARRDAGVSLRPAAVRRLVQHLTAFRRDAAFPGKAIRFLEWLSPGGGEARPEGVAGASGGTRSLDAREVSELFARHTGLAVDLIADDRRVTPDALSAALRAHVIGQDHACDTAARALARFKAGLNDPERPVATLLFAGPTGVGKTELARAIARYLYGDESRLIRLDMSEYMFPGAGQRMLEASQGSAGLAARVRDQPLSLVLLDEVEKAHADVFDLLLGLLGEGRLTDSYGAVVDFRMALVVMTSNLGVAEGRPVGFGEAGGGDPSRAIRRHFRPEFFNRIDHVVGFRALSPDDVLRIVDLELAKAAGRTGLVRRNVRIEVDAASRRRLAELGFHPARGARPLRRVIEERVVAPVAALLADDPALRDRVLRVDAEGAVRAL